MYFDFTEQLHLFIKYYFNADLGLVNRITFGVRHYYLLNLLYDLAKAEVLPGILLFRKVRNTIKYNSN